MQNEKTNKIPILASILLHFAVFMLLFLHLPVHQNRHNEDVTVIQAVALSASQLKYIQPHKPPVATPPAPKVTPPVPSQEVAKPEPKPKVVAKPKATPAIDLEPPKKEVAQLQAPDLDVLEKKHQEEQKRQEAAKLKAQQQKQRKAEEAKRLEQELAREKAGLENQKPAVAPSHTDEDLQSELKQEQQQLAAATEVGELDKYKRAIMDTISRKWLIPETMSKDLTCQLLVHLGPGGVVISVDIVKESGDPNLDRSARNAIMKASPLPVPDNSDLFDKFRALRLTFRPQGLISE